MHSADVQVESFRILKLPPDPQSRLSSATPLPAPCQPCPSRPSWEGWGPGGINQRSAEVGVYVIASEVVGCQNVAVTMDVWPLSTESATLQKKRGHGEPRFATLVWRLEGGKGGMGQRQGRGQGGAPGGEVGGEGGAQGGGPQPPRARRPGRPHQRGPRLPHPVDRRPAGSPPIICGPEWSENGGRGPGLLLLDRRAGLGVPLFRQGLPAAHTTAARHGRRRHGGPCGRGGGR